ncbi:hypothetical protein GCM10007392_05910 [Saccharospirillum salsuginis]|uniref:Uncharacterized protein n=1 Tax=Saccharospirillum salsuginis TaxID=418750 RepID=A0A918K192_9GAMM|nr:hypothetical protein GCM10007392_05910 [Saccharospirillum salsuginis]
MRDSRHRSDPLCTFNAQTVTASRQCSLREPDNTINIVKRPAHSGLTGNEQCSANGLKGF